MAQIGSGHILGDINGALSTFVRHCRGVKRDGSALQAWFDRACGAANNGSNGAARASTLKGKIESNGGTISQADAELMVRAFDEALYWAASYAPTYSLDVSGPLV